MGKYTPAFNIWTLPTLGIATYTWRTLGIDIGFWKSILGIVPNILFLARFNPNYSYLSSEMPYIAPPKDGASLYYTCAMEFSTTQDGASLYYTYPPVLQFARISFNRETIASRWCALHTIDNHISLRRAAARDNRVSPRAPQRKTIVSRRAARARSKIKSRLMQWRDKNKISPLLAWIQ